MDIMKKVGIVVAVFVAITGSMWLAGWFFEIKAFLPLNILAECVMVAAFWAVVYFTKDIVRAKVLKAAQIKIGEQPVEKSMEKEHDESVGKAYDNFLQFLALCFAVLVCCWFYTGANPHFDLVWAGLAGLFGFFAYTTQSVMVRHLADIGAWCVRIPENRAAVIEKDGAVWRIIINITDKDRREHFMSQAQEKYGEIIHVLPLGEGLYFYGWTKWPWVYRLHKPWYESRDDAADPNKKPEEFLLLNMREWNFWRQSGSKGSIPAVQTLDPIDVAADVFVTAVIWDPYKALYNRAEELFGDAVLQTLIADLRAVIAELSYFGQKDGSLVVNSAIQQDVEDKLREKLGLKNQKLILDYVNETQAGNEAAVLPSELFLTLFYKCLVDYGYQLRDIKVTDLDPAVPDDLQHLKSIPQAQARRERDVIEADGRAQVKILEAKADATALQLKRDQVNQPGGLDVLQASTAVQVASSVERLVVISGNGGDATNAVATFVAMGGSATIGSGNSAKASPEPKEETPEGSACKPENPKTAEKAQLADSGKKASVPGKTGEKPNQKGKSAAPADKPRR